MKLVFVGEKRSDRARRMRVRWEDGRLAAAQLFPALRAAGVDPMQAHFVNLFERGGPSRVRELRAQGFAIVGMGRKVQAALARAAIEHTPLVHPAARGRIRLRSRYRAHVRAALASIVR